MSSSVLMMTYSQVDVVASGIMMYGGRTWLYCSSYTSWSHCGLSNTLLVQGCSLLGTGYFDCTGSGRGRVLL